MYDPSPLSICLPRTQRLRVSPGTRDLPVGGSEHTLFSIRDLPFDGESRVGLMTQQRSPPTQECSLGTLVTIKPPQPKWTVKEVGVRPTSVESLPTMGTLESHTFSSPGTPSPPGGPFVWVEERHSPLRPQKRNDKVPSSQCYSLYCSQKIQI